MLVSSGRSNTCAARRAAKAAAGPKSNWSRVTSEIASDGMPSSVPSIAAETVPEYVMSSPRLAPLLMPESSKPGRAGRMPDTARFTQSVGVPSTENCRGPISSTRNGRCSVREWLTALCSRSGATT